MKDYKKIFLSGTLGMSQCIFAPTTKVRGVKSANTNGSRKGKKTHDEQVTAEHNANVEQVVTEVHDEVASQDKGSNVSEAVSEKGAELNDSLSGSVSTQQFVDSIGENMDQPMGRSRSGVVEGSVVNGGVVIVGEALKRSPDMNSSSEAQCPNMLRFGRGNDAALKAPVTSIVAEADKGVAQSSVEADKGVSSVLGEFRGSSGVEQDHAVSALRRAEDMHESSEAQAPNMLPFSGAAPRSVSAPVGKVHVAEDVSVQPEIRRGLAVSTLPRESDVNESSEAQEPHMLPLSGGAPRSLSAPVSSKPVAESEKRSESVAGSERQPESVGAVGDIVAVESSLKGGSDDEGSDFDGESSIVSSLEKGTSRDGGNGSGGASSHSGAPVFGGNGSDSQSFERSVLKENVAIDLEGRYSFNDKVSLCGGVISSVQNHCMLLSLGYSVTEAVLIGLGLKGFVLRGPAGGAAEGNVPGLGVSLCASADVHPHVRVVFHVSYDWGRDSKSFVSAAIGAGYLHTRNKMSGCAGVASLIAHNLSDDK